MTLRLLVGILLLAASPALANSVRCGGNSLSYGEVDSGPPLERRRGVIEAVPDSVCADLIERRPQAIESLSVVIDPRSRQDAPATPGSSVGNEGFRPSRR